MNPVYVNEHHTKKAWEILFFQDIYWKRVSQEPWTTNGQVRGLQAYMNHTILLIEKLMHIDTTNKLPKGY